MKYKLNEQQQAEVQLTINSVVFTATCTEAQLNDLFGEADCFDSEEDYDDYITDGSATEDWSIDVSNYPDLADDDNA
jgi:hypothetical protein